MKTAVEWLEEQIYLYGINPHQSLFEQAKEMEKEQMIEFAKYASNWQAEKTYSGEEEPLNMYSLDCDYYTKQFSSLDALLIDIATSGMDPNYPITFNGNPTGDLAIDLLQF
jgi:hypothetical protein